MPARELGFHSTHNGVQHLTRKDLFTKLILEEPFKLFTFPFLFFTMSFTREHSSILTLESSFGLVTERSSGVRESRVQGLRLLALGDELSIPKPQPSSSKGCELETQSRFVAA